MYQKNSVGFFFCKFFGIFNITYFLLVGESPENLHFFFKRHLLSSEGDSFFAIDFEILINIIIFAYDETI
jgi:hypothetical protein